MKSLFDQEYIMDLFGREKKAEGIAEGKAEGIAEEHARMQAVINKQQAESAKRLLDMDWSVEKIAGVLGISPRSVQDLLGKPA